MTGLLLLATHVVALMMGAWLYGAIVRARVHEKPIRRRNGVVTGWMLMLGNMVIAEVRHRNSLSLPRQRLTHALSSKWRL